MKRIGDDAFIIMSGPPEKGKRERISKVRSHIKKGYFKQKLKKQMEVLAAEKAKCAYEVPCRERLVERALANRVFCTTAPFRHVLKGEGLISESTQRVQRFIETHIRTDDKDDQYQTQIMQWTIYDPHFTSGKLLIASGWDDLQEYGELSRWTIHQRHITVRLLEDALRHNFEDHKPSTLGAIQSLLAFEILNGAVGNYTALRRFSKSIMTQPYPQTEEIIWNILEGGFFLLDHTYSLFFNLGGGRDHKIGFSLPLDIDIFTLGCDYTLEENALLLTLLKELYFMLWVGGEYSEVQTPQSVYDYIYTQWCDLQQGIMIEENPVASKGCENVRASAIRLCIFILATYLLGPEMTNNIQPSHLTPKLQKFLKSTGYGLKAHNLWKPFPGAMICCQMIGTWFSERPEKMWYAIHFLKLSHAWILTSRDKSLTTISFFSNVMGKIQRLEVAEA